MKHSFKKFLIVSMMRMGGENNNVSTATDQIHRVLCNAITKTRQKKKLATIEKWATCCIPNRIGSAIIIIGYSKKHTHTIQLNEEITRLKLFNKFEDSIKSRHFFSCGIDVNMCICMQCWNSKMDTSVCIK